MPKDERLKAPLYSIKEVAWYLNVAESTLAGWARRQTVSGRPLITHIDGRGRFEPTVPFIGMAEAYVVAAFKQHTKRLRMRYVLDVLTKLEEEEGGIEHLLASKRLRLHGHQLLINVGEESDDPAMAEHVEALTRNKVFEKVVAGHLKYLHYAEDELAEKLILPITSEPLIEMTPRRAYGQPVYIRGGARMVDVLDRYNAGEHPEVIAKDFRLKEDEVLDTLRAFTKRATQEAA